MNLWLYANKIEVKPSKSGVYTETMKLFKLLSVDTKYSADTYKILAQRVLKVHRLLVEFEDEYSAISIYRKLKQFNTSVQHKDEK